MHSWQINSPSPHNLYQWNKKKSLIPDIPLSTKHISQTRKDTHKSKQNHMKAWVNWLQKKSRIDSQTPINNFHHLQKKTNNQPPWAKQNRRGANCTWNYQNPENFTFWLIWKICPWPEELNCNWDFRNLALCNVILRGRRKVDPHYFWIFAHIILFQKCIFCAFCTFFLLELFSFLCFFLGFSPCYKGFHRLKKKLIWNKKTCLKCIPTKQGMWFSGEHRQKIRSTQDKILGVHIKCGVYNCKQQTTKCNQFFSTVERNLIPQNSNLGKGSRIGRRKNS